MIFVGIDVAKDKHDCFILNSEGTVLAAVSYTHLDVYKRQTVCAAFPSNWVLCRFIR